MNPQGGPSRETSWPTFDLWHCPCIQRARDSVANSWEHWVQIAQGKRKELIEIESELPASCKLPVASCKLQQKTQAANWKTAIKVISHCKLSSPAAACHSLGPLTFILPNLHFNAPKRGGEQLGNTKKKAKTAQQHATCNRAAKAMQM